MTMTGKIRYMPPPLVNKVLKNLTKNIFNETFFQLILPMKRNNLESQRTKLYFSFNAPTDFQNLNVIYCTTYPQFAVHSVAKFENWKYFINFVAFWIESDSAASQCHSDLELKIPFANCLVLFCPL